MAQIQAKICMLGAFGVGKTSLVARYVNNVYSDKYLTTVGVKIDTKQVEVDGTTVKMVLWDIAGEAELSATTRTYLRGAAGFLVVADGTRRPTLDAALGVLAQADATGCDAVVLLNKCDLVDEWELSPEDTAQVAVPVSETSAKTGAGVEEAVESLARAIISRRASS